MTRPELSDHRSEFGVLAGWTTEALLHADPPTRVAAACRGSGSPTALAWLAESIRVDETDSLLDVGSGLGGASAWAAERYGTHPVAVEPMSEAAEGSRRLFGMDVVIGAAEHLPLPDARFDAAWCLGVLDTVGDPLASLREIRRVLCDNGRLGLIAYLADGPIDSDSAPRGNEFQESDAFDRSLAEAGFTIVDRSSDDQLPDVPVDWQRRQDLVEDEMVVRHGTDPRWVDAKQQERRFGELLSSGAVRLHLLHTVCV